MTSSVVGTVKKYRNAFAIKKHNAQVRAWAAPMALDIAVAFWDTWKAIEKKLPDGDDFPETSSEKREAKNKYEAIIELEISRQSPLLTNTIQSYTQKVWIAGAVEQCRRLGCLSWFLSSLTRLPYQRESQTQPTVNLVESSVVFFGISPEGSYDIGVFTDDEGKSTYVAKYKGNVIYNKWSNTNGVGLPLTSIPENVDVSYNPGSEGNVVRTTKSGGEKLPTAKKMAQQLGTPSTQTSQTKSATKKTSKKTSQSVGSSFSLPNTLAQRYSNERAAEAVTQINDTTRKELSSIINRGVESGTSYGDIAKEIKTKFEQFAVPKPQQHIPNRAVLVAVTELGNAYCQATLDLADSLQSSGVRMMKAWQTLEDNRVSDGCRHNQNAGWIELDGTFPSGASRPPRFPGCRCDILTDMLDESMLGRSIDDYFDRPDEENVSIQVQQKRGTKKTAAVKQKPGMREKLKPAATDKKAKIRVPNWKEWDGIERKFYDVSSDSVDVRIRDAFMKGRAADRYRIKNKSALNLLKAHDMSFKNMAKDGIRAIKEYTTAYYDVINNVLRSGTGDKDDLDLIRSMKKAISEHGITTEDMVVTRNFEGDWWKDWKEGDTKKLPEFVSTTVADYRESGFGGENVAHIYVPANKGNGVYIDGESEEDSECEYLIQAGSSFRVHHIEKIDGKTHYYLELIVQ